MAIEHLQPRTRCTSAAKLAPKFLSVFSGAGGLDLGLEYAGFQSVGCIERDQHALATLRLNRPDWTIIEPGDISIVSKTLEPRALGLRRRQLDLLVGGPPCQPFSKAAQWSQTARQGIRDPRANCVEGFLELVDRFLPRAILLENVQGFVSGKANALGSISHALEAINRRSKTKYRLQYWVVDTADFGVPQKRKRAILFAERGGAELPLPEPRYRGNPLTAWDAIGHLTVKHRNPRLSHWLKLLPSIPEGNNYQWHTRRGGGRPLFGYRTKFWSFLLKLEKAQPAWTLSAQPGPYTGPFHWDNRRLTIQEMLLLQSFPESWKLCGTAREQIRQIGNATPPLIAEMLGRVIAKEILSRPVSDELVLQISRSEGPFPPPVRVKVIDRSFHELEGFWPDHPGTGYGPRPIKISWRNR